MAAGRWCGVPAAGRLLCVWGQPLPAWPVRTGSREEARGACSGGTAPAGLQRGAVRGGGWELVYWEEPCCGEGASRSCVGGIFLTRRWSGTGRARVLSPDGVKTTRGRKGTCFKHRWMLRPWLCPSTACEKERLECGSMGKWTPQRARCAVPVTNTRFLMCAVKLEREQIDCSSPCVVGYT